MKIAVLADIHGNLEALRAVHVDLIHAKADRVICLGDNIGYGPDPEKVVQFLLQSGYESVLGNHEFALMDERGRRWLNFQAAENNIDTEKLLSPESRLYCCHLPSFLEVDNARFVHAFPPNSVFRYLHRQSDEKIITLFTRTTCPLYFVGHTHRLQLITVGEQGVQRQSLAEEKIVFSPEAKYIVNCGSVGQPRGKDYRAKYLIWDCQQKEIEVRFVHYDYELTVEKIRQRGFPEAYAIRLGKR